MVAGCSVRRRAAPPRSRPLRRERARRGVEAASFGAGVLILGTGLQGAEIHIPQRWNLRLDGVQRAPQGPLAEDAEREELQRLEVPETAAARIVYGELEPRHAIGEPPARLAQRARRTSQLC